MNSYFSLSPESFAQEKFNSYLRIYCFQLSGCVPPLFHYRGGKSTAHIQFTLHQWTTKSFGHKHLSLTFLDSASHSAWFLLFEDRCWENLEKSVAQLCVIWLLAMAGPLWVCKFVVQKKCSYWACAVWVTSLSLAVTWCFWHCMSCFFCSVSGQYTDWIEQMRTPLWYLSSYVWLK